MNLIGQVILNQFRVDNYVASGGMGVVYRVWDTNRNVTLAMKVLHTELAEEPSIFKRFQREARALEKLAHPNIVPFYGLYRTQDFAFLLERFIDGPSLKEILRQRRAQPLSFNESLIYLKDLCAALGYAHHHGVVHCDVKPGNVMVDQGGNVYLTDFGIARHADSTTTTLATVGTAAYMAPEQIRGEAVSPATDVYAIGVVLFEMLTGQRPFRGNESGTESAGATANERVRYAHMKLSPPDPRSFNPSIPSLLSQVILKALSKEPNQRLPSTQAFYTAVCASLQTNPEQVPDRITTSSLPPRSFEPPLIHSANADVAIGTFTPGESESSEQPQREKRPVPFGTKGVFLLGGFFVVILMVIFLSGGGASPGNTPTPNSVGGLVVTETSVPLPSSTPPAPNQTDSAYISTAAAMTVMAQLTSEAPTMIPTEIAHPSDTPAPFPTDTPSLTPSFGEIRFCSDVTCSQGNKIQYPEGIKDVYFMFDYHNMKPGMSYGRRWYVNGGLYLDYVCNWGPNWPSDGTFVKKVYDHYYGLAPGEWLLEIYIEGQPQSTASFNVKGPTRYEDFLENYTCNDTSPTLP